MIQQENVSEQLCKADKDSLGLQIHSFSFSPVVTQISIYLVPHQSHILTNVTRLSKVLRNISVS